jgi:antirestriction protein ArdC
VTTTAPRKRRAYDGPSPEERLVDDLIRLMESSDLPPWRRPWGGGQGAHRNLLSGHHCQGANPILLEIGSMMDGHTMPLWVGGAEAKKRGWWPRKGSRAVRIVRPQLNQREQTDANGSPVLDASGNAVIAAWVSFKLVCVFNAADLTSNDADASASLTEAIRDALGVAETAPDGARLEKAESALAAWTVPTDWGESRCAYLPSLDRIQMPFAESFSSREAFCSTWAHEMAHSTGHSSRLDRKLTSDPSTHDYEREELIAELASVLICYRLNIGCELQNHAAYLNHWVRMLREEGPRCLFKVLSDARKAADLIAPEAPAEEA